MPITTNPTFPEGRSIPPGNSPVQGRAKALSHDQAKRMIEARKMPGKIFDPKAPRRIKGRKAKSLAEVSLIPAQFDIASVAASLSNDADKIYQWVASNIDFLPTFGSQKGALGCMIDRQGNSFDQSALMVALLQSAGYTAKFMFGELRITAAVAAAWLGTDALNAYSSSNYLANGGIPASVEFDAGTSTYYVILSHCWVKVTISGTDYVFDPTLKTYTVTAPIDLATVSGYNATTFETASLTGATVTADYVQNVNTANMETEFNTMASNLISWINTNKPDATVEDIIGGRKLVPVTSVLRNTSLSYQRASTTPIEWLTIPNTYKTTFSVLYDTISQSFYSEDIFSKRLSITFNASLEAELRLDGTLLGTSTAQGAGTYNSVLLTIEHPYGATWADQSFWQTVWAGKPYLIAQSWGNTTKEMAHYHQRLLNDNILAGGLDDDENVICESLSVLWHNWAANKSIVASMIGRMNNCACVLHHQVGLVGHYDGPFTDLGGILWSSSALDNDYTRVYATDTMLALRGVAFESNSIAQVPNVEGVSSDTVIGTANALGQKLYMATSTNWTTTVRPALVNYPTSVLDNIENWYINNGWNVLIHEDGDTNQNQYHGYGFFAVGQFGGAVGIINGYLLGGGSAFVQSTAQTNTQSKSLNNQGKDWPIERVEVDNIVDKFSGHFTYRHTDFTIGSGPAPLSLDFTRFFDNRRIAEFSHAGYGWRHNYMITAEAGNDGFAALGDQAAIAAAAGLIFAQVGILQLQGGGFGQNFALMSLGALYASKQLTQNVVRVKDGDRSYTFTKLMDGTYLPPKGVGLGLIFNTVGGNYIMENYDGDKWTFRVDGRIDKIEYKQGVTLNFTYSGFELKLATVSNTLGHTLTFDYGLIGGAVSYLTKVTDETTQFTEYEMDFTSSFRIKKYKDKAGQFHEYFYDSKGRMESFKLPSTFSVTNIYDAQDRVISQTDPGGNISLFSYNGNFNTAQRAGRIIQTHFNGDGKPTIIADGSITTNYGYDGLGRQTSMYVYATGGGGGSPGPTTSYEYDGFNRITKKTISGTPNLVETFGYTGSLTRWTTHTNARGYTTTRVLNSKALPDSETGPTVGGSTPVSSWTYDTYGRVATATDPTGLVTKFVYGNISNTGKDLTSEVHNDGGLNLTTGYGYDSIGNRTSVTNPRGYTTTFTFDLLRRPLTKTDTAPFGHQTEWSYDTLGNRLMERRLINGIWQTQNWTYSPTNKVLTHTDFLGQVTTNTYDTYDRLATTTDAQSRLTQFFYDTTNRLTSIIDANNVTAEQRRYTPNGLLYQLTDARLNVTTYSYDQYERKYRCPLCL